MAQEESPEELLRRTMEFVAQHRANYIASGGAQGHIMDMSHAGFNGMCPTLLLRTIGRKSGNPLIIPLIYGVMGGEWIVVASKGGAPDHPAWLLNLKERKDAQFQVASQCFEGSWRIAEGDERETVWSYMTRVFPPYGDYQQSAGGRVIPLVLLRPSAQIEPFKA